MAEHKSLFAALAAFQAEAPTLPKTATNPHFRSKFTPLDVIVEQTRGLLSKHGIVWIAKPGENADGKPVLDYTLAHAASGEREDGSMPLLLAKPDSQGQGSAITYARRYALCAVLNLVADDDDDGNAASRGQNGQAQKPAAKPLSADNRGKVLKAFDDAQITDMRPYLTAVGIQAVEQMTAEHAVKLRGLLDQELAQRETV